LTLPWTPWALLPRPAPPWWHVPPSATEPAAPALPLDPTPPHTLATSLPVPPALRAGTLVTPALSAPCRVPWSWGEGVLTIAGIPAGKVIIDTGAQPLIIGKQFKRRLEQEGVRFEDTGLRLAQAGRARSSTLGTSCEALSVTFFQGIPGKERSVPVRVVATEAEGFDVLLGVEFCMFAELVVDFGAETVHYSLGWKGEGAGKAQAPSALHQGEDLTPGA